MELTADAILDELRAQLRRNGRPDDVAGDTGLEAIGYRSIDLSELALHVEERIGRELNFSAAGVRRLERVDDVVAFIQEAARGA